MKGQWSVSGNHDVQGLLLYMLGYSYLVSGDREAALQVLRTLKGRHKNLALLLDAHLNLP